MGIFSTPFSPLVPTDKLYMAPFRTYQYCKVRKGAMYHLSVGISESGYPFTLIHTNKLYMGPFYALNSTNNCEVRLINQTNVVISSNLHDVHLPQKSPTVCILGIIVKSGFILYLIYHSLILQFRV